MRCIRTGSVCCLGYSAHSGVVHYLSVSATVPRSTTGRIAGSRREGPTHAAITASVLASPAPGIRRLSDTRLRPHTCVTAHTTTRLLNDSILRTHLPTCAQLDYAWCSSICAHNTPPPLFTARVTHFLTRTSRSRAHRLLLARSGDTRTHPHLRMNHAHRASSPAMESSFTAGLVHALPPARLLASAGCCLRYLYSRRHAAPSPFFLLTDHIRCACWDRTHTFLCLPRLGWVWIALPRTRYHFRHSAPRLTPATGLHAAPEFAHAGSLPRTALITDAHARGPCCLPASAGYISQTHKSMLLTTPLPRTPAARLAVEGLRQSLRASAQLPLNYPPLSRLHRSAEFPIGTTTAGGSASPPGRTLFSSAHHGRSRCTHALITPLPLLFLDISTLSRTAAHWVCSALSRLTFTCCL